jgi:hypothetical protein
VSLFGCYATCILDFCRFVTIAITGSVLQLKSITKSTFALSFARVLMADMMDFASKVRGYNATLGLLKAVFRGAPGQKIDVRSGSPIFFSPPEEPWFCA